MKLWGGRFSGETDASVEAFTSSLVQDSRMWQADLIGSMAHARMMGDAGILTAAEASTLIEGLKKIEHGVLNGEIVLDPNAEDIHSAVEKKLTELTGPLAGKLHTARSRNDQSPTGTRLYLAGQMKELDAELESVQREILRQAKNHLHTILPGLTHWQHAQPVSLAHHLMATLWMLQRDRERLRDGLHRVLRLPLGSGALAGTGFPLNRDQVAKELGFEGITENSLDAVSDRDFVVEFLSGASLIMTHLSRLAEELIVWSTPEFGFVELSDKVTTGSSMMPQKKNPDVAELIRGRVGRVTGALVGALTTLKALPLSYNRDLQEDKTYLFEGLDTTRACVRMTKMLLAEAKWNTERMEMSTRGDFSNATDLADDLVRKGIPFREAHEIIGKLVVHCLDKKLVLENMTVDELKQFHPSFDEVSRACLPAKAVMNARTSAGGTSPASVEKQIALAEKTLAAFPG